MQYRDERKSGKTVFRHRPAFTLAELVVSIAVMVILLGITGMIYKSASDAMDLNNASVTILEDNAALTKQIDLTLGNINTDGYLVIYGYDLQNQNGKTLVEKTPDGKIKYDLSADASKLPVRSDAICFFTSGNFSSRVNNNISANTGWVYIGHAGSVNPSTYGSAPFDDEDTLAVNRWVLSKYQILFTPGQAGMDYIDGSIPKYLHLYIDFENDFLTNNLQGIREWFYKNWINDRWEDTGTTFWNTPAGINFENKAVDGIAANRTFPYTIPNCGSFKVEFVMPKSYFDVKKPNDEPEVYTDGTVVWRDAINLRPYNPNDSNERAVDLATGLKPINAGDLDKRSNDAIAVFGPKDVWPLMIKFTIRKYDENLKVISDEKYIDGSHTASFSHGGQTLEYVFKLPVKQ